MVKINNNIRGLKLNLSGGNDPYDRYKRKHTNKGYTYILDNNRVKFIVLDSEPYILYKYEAVNPFGGTDEVKVPYTVYMFEKKLNAGQIRLSYMGRPPMRFTMNNPARDLYTGYHSRKKSNQMIKWYYDPAYKARNKRR